MNKFVKGRVLIAAVLVITMLTSAILASCDVGMEEGGLLESIPDLTQSAAEDSKNTDETVSTPEGYTEAPVITNIINISPYDVVIAGTCEYGATVTIGSTTQQVSVVSKNGYFITGLTLTSKNITLLEATAVVEGKEESLPTALTAQYSAIAESRLDGMSVSVGKDSHTYFDMMIDDYTGSNLFTQTQLRNFKNAVNSSVTAINQRGDGEEVDIIYVFIPDSTSIYDEYLDDSIVRETTTTRYQQTVEALKNTEATVVDMYSIFTEAKESGEYRLYRDSDSHMTEYAAFLTYTEIMNVIAKRFPDAAPHTADEFSVSEVDTIGGDLISYLGVDTSIVTEQIPLFTPKFDMNIGDNESSAFITTKLSDVKIYSGAGDYSVNTAKETASVLTRMYFRTGRTELPSALIYRDDASANLVTLIAERLDNTMLGASGDFTINYTDAGRHASDGKSKVDYIIVIVNESNISKIVG